MSIVKTNTTLVRYKGRLFVGLCNCTDPKSSRFDVPLVYDGGQRIDASPGKHSDLCTVCSKYIWIILPKAEVFNGYKPTEIIR